MTPAPEWLRASIHSALGFYEPGIRAGPKGHSWSLLQDAWFSLEETIAGEQDSRNLFVHVWQLMLPACWALIWVLKRAISLRSIIKLVDFLIWSSEALKVGV